MRDREREMRGKADGRETKGTRREEEEGDVSIAFHSKVHGGQDVGMHRSKMDSGLKVY